MLSELEKNINYTFKDKERLKNALTHSSYSNEIGIKKQYSNERLEFLGDAVLELVTSEIIYTKFPDMPEGDMTKLRAKVVCETSLFEKANALNIGEFLLLGKGEESSGGRQRPSLLADAFEAVLGAIFLDSGFEAARKYVLRIFEREFSDENSVKKHDYKTELQELIQRDSREPLEYVIVKESGPDHDKFFASEVVHQGRIIGKGEGRSKKEAEQNAAKMALEK